MGITIARKNHGPWPPKKRHPTGALAVELVSLPSRLYRSARGKGSAEQACRRGRRSLGLRRLDRAIGAWEERTREGQEGYD